MDAQEELLELESLLPTMNDLIWVGFIINDNEEKIWHRIINWIDYEQKKSQKDSSYQQKFKQGF